MLLSHVNLIDKLLNYAPLEKWTETSITVESENLTSLELKMRFDELMLFLKLIQYKMF